MTNKRLVKLSFEKTRGKNLDSDKNMKAFVDWLRDNDVKSDDLFFKIYDNEERGVYTRNKIVKNTTFMYIPRNVLITDMMGRETPWGKKIENSNIFNNRQDLVMKIMFVMVYILSTIDDDNSLYKPYYDILPSVMDNFPIFWDDEELEDLKGSPFLKLINNRKKSIIRDYNDIEKVIPELGEKFSLDDFMWCRTIVGSRNFGLKIDGKQTTTMVPLADMLNHFRPAETKWYFDNNEDGYVMRSLEDLPAKTQVMDSYGPKSNYKYLLHYGFTQENTPETEELSYLEFDIEVGEEKFNINIKANLKSSNTKNLFAYLRKAVADRNEKVDNYYNKISDRNEMAMLALLSFICRKKLLKYKNSYSKNLKLLKKYKKFSTKRNICVIILGEQKILKFYIDYAYKEIIQLSE